MSKILDILSTYGNQLSESAGVRKRTVGCEPIADALMIPVDRIDADPEQPRRTFDEEELYRLAGSLRSKGQQQPIRVRYDDRADRYVIVAGERRWRAAKIAGLPALQCIVDGSDSERLALLELALVENLVREDLSPLDTARAYERLMESRGCTGKELAEFLNVAPSKVSRALALLKLPEDAQQQIETGELKGREVRELIAKPAATKRKTKTKKAPKRTEETLRTTNGAKVVVSFGKLVDPSEIVNALMEAVDRIRQTIEPPAAQTPPISESWAA